MYKKISIFFITILSFLVLLTGNIHADNNISFGDIEITVKDETVTVNIRVSGFVDEIPFSIKCLNTDGAIEFIDFVYAKNGYINSTFIPMNAQKEDSLILKITGVTTATKTFRYTEDGTLEEVLDDRYQGTLDLISSKYSTYEDIVGNINFKIEMDVNNDYAKLTLKGTSFKSSDNVWKNKDSERWNSYLNTIANEIIKVHNKSVRINVFDANKKLVDNKLFDAQGEWGQNISQLIKDLNASYSKIKIGGKSYSVRYERGDVDTEFHTGDILFLDTRVSGYAFDNVTDAHRQDLQTHFDNVYSYIKKHCFYDTTFRVYKPNGQLYLPQTFVYFSESTGEEQTGYEPLDYTRGSFPIELMNYGKNSVIIPANAISVSSKNGFYELSITDSSSILSSLSSLKNDNAKQVVFGYDPNVSTTKIKMSVSPSVLTVLKNNRATLTFNNPLMQINVPYDVYDTSSSLIFEVEKMGKDEEYFGDVGRVYQVTLSYADGSPVEGGGITGVYRIDPLFNEYMEDIRKVNIMQSEELEFYESDMLNTTYNSGLLGLVFAFNGNGYYRCEENIVDFYDTEGHWAEDPISVVAAKGMVEGTGYGMFEPNTTLTRGHYVTIISRHLGIVPSGKIHFVDVKPTDWYAEFANAAKEYGLLPSVWGETFSGNTPITREEIAYITMKAYMTVSGEKLSGGTPIYNDSAEISSWAVNSIAMAQQKKIMQGYGNGDVGPKKNITRAEACQVIYNLLKAEGAF